MEDERNAKGQFAPGKSGNPGGQPKNEEWKQILTKKTPEVLRKLATLMDSPKDSISLRAIEVFLTYSLPKPRQETSIELTGANGGYIGIDAPRSESKEQWLERRAREKAAKTLNGTNGVSS